MPEMQEIFSSLYGRANAETSDGKMKIQPSLFSVPRVVLISHQLQNHKGGKRSVMVEAGAPATHRQGAVLGVFEV